MPRLTEGRSVIVTGAGRGIGRAEAPAGQPCCAAEKCPAGRIGPQHSRAVGGPQPCRQGARGMGREPWIAAVPRLVIAGFHQSWMTGWVGCRQTGRQNSTAKE